MRVARLGALQYDVLRAAPARAERKAGFDASCEAQRFGDIATGNCYGKSL